MAARAKKNLRFAADAYRRYKHAKDYQFDPEEEHMAGVVRRKNRVGLGQLEGIRQLKFTAGESESGLFMRQNKLLFEKGLPYYRRMDRSIDVDGATFLWLEPTLEGAEHITNIELSHSNPDNPNYKNLGLFGYTAVSHPQLKLIIWTKADPKKDKIISEFIICHTEKEENRLAVDGCERCIENLVEFGLPDATLWVRKIDRNEVPLGRNIAAITNELEKVKKLKESSPDDPTVLELEERLIAKLKDAYLEEVQSEVRDPIKYAKELLALDDSDMIQWVKLFEKVDKTKRTKVTLDEIFESWDDYPVTEIHRHLFASLDSCDAEGLVEFGDYLRSCAVFGMFGKEELLRSYSLHIYI